MRRIDRSIIAEHHEIAIREYADAATAYRFIRSRAGQSADQCAGRAVEEVYSSGSLHPVYSQNRVAHDEVAICQRPDFGPKPAAGIITWVSQLERCRGSRGHGEQKCNSQTAGHTFASAGCEESHGYPLGYASRVSVSWDSLNRALF